MRKLCKKVFVGMSGGVDSSVTAALMRERGFDVVGVHIKMWSDPSIPCNFKEDRYDAMRAAEKIGIPFQTWDFTEEYRTAVVEYMIREYAGGRTPNPDVMCNRHIKFGIFLKRALEQGADYVATGHYIRLASGCGTPRPYLSETRSFHPAMELAQHPARRSVRIDGDHAAAETGRSASQERLASGHPDGFLKTRARPAIGNDFHLLKAKDLNKDQSYFLWTLTQGQLRHTLFPIGEYAKPEVRAMARLRGLPTAEKKDSQGICFIGEINLPEFLKKYIEIRRGPVMTTAGKTVGEHDGLSFYTIGQREGLGTGGGGIPYYVAQKDFEKNTLVVAEGPYDEKLFSREITVGDVNWISGAPPKLPLMCEARIRYRQPLQGASIKYKVSRRQADSLIHDTEYIIRFDEPQRAVTPGQSVVFYSGEEMLGGGVIR